MNPGLQSQNFLVRSLMADRVVGEADVKRALEHAAAHRVDPSESLVALGLVSQRQLALSKAKLCEYPFVDLAWFDIDIRNARRLPRAAAERLTVFPLFVFERVATVAMLDPLNLPAIDQVRQLLKLDVEPVVCDAEQLRALISRAYSLAPAVDEERPSAGPDAALTTGDEPIVAATNQIIIGAIECGASDVHVNPEEHELLLRYRVDGVLRVQQGPPRSAHAGIVQRIKVLANLDLAQTRRPQDGKFRFTHRGETVDVRVSLTPTVAGENAVLRLLRAAKGFTTVAELSMPADVAAVYEESLQRPHGMILVTGPTGSGKTTTLYTGLARLNHPSRNVMTIEDPVEIRMPLVRQIQVNPDVGVTFASALRSVLRQDPNVVLVGEIRDEETARIAAQAALTGHLVLSTLHTNDSIGAISRLRDFGVPAFAINSALLCVIAQRLVRRVCATCALPDAPDEAMLARWGLSRDGAGTLRRGVGCAACGSSGYKGRLGVYEVFRITPGIQTLIDDAAPVSDVRAAALGEGFRPLWRDGLEKALAGATCLDELMKVRASFDAAAVRPADALRRAAA